MSEEEEEAIKKLSSSKNETTWNDTIRQIKKEGIIDVVVTRQKYITTILNLIEKQQKEIEKLEDQKEYVINEYGRTIEEKDKIIDLMAEFITELKPCYFKKEDGGELLGKYRCYNKNEWKEYFTNKVEEDIKNENHRFIK